MKPSDGQIYNETPSNCKIILDQNIPIEELLGSVTTYNNVDGSDTRSLQLRTSARVFKKMKLDSANATTVTSEKKEPIKEESKPEVKKPYRPLWSHEDKNLFFEALNEYGKDFEAIHSYISSKLKKKGLSDSMIKTREQVRHLYYRTWHKISKYLRFSDDVKKVGQELYGLINYGELRKKLSIISEKTCIKLNELMYRGSVAIRVKGKTIRIKTPMCRALRKLNQLDENHDDLKLPTRVSVELHPKNMNTWMRVQNMAQNPRVKTTLPLQKRLSSLISCMSERWKTHTTVEYHKVLNSAKSMSENCGLVDDILEDSKFIPDPPFRLCPPKSCIMEVPTVNLTEYLTNQSICLNAYEERTGIKDPGEQIWLNSFPSSGKGTTKKTGIKRTRNESSSEKSSPTNLSKTSGNIDNNENCLNDCDVSTAVNEVIDEAVNTILALQNQDENCSSDEKPCENVDIKEEIEENRCDIKTEHILKLQNGWTIYNCGTLCIGDLYLMFGSDSKLILEYSWDYEGITPLKKENEYIEHKSQDDELNDDTQKELEVSQTSVNLNVCKSQSLADNNFSLSLTLKRLLSVAKLHYRKNRIRCPCGHICGSPSKTNISRNKTLTKNFQMSNTGEKFYRYHDKPILQSEHAETHTTTFHPGIMEPHIRRLSPSTLFRRPSSPNDILRAQLDSIQRLKPRYCNRRGRRPRTKQVVVERKLPILANKAENGRQIVQMNIISQDSLPTNPRPIIPKISLNLDTNDDDNDEHVKMENLEAALSEKPDADKPNSADSIIVSDNATTSSRIGSPTSISNLIEMALKPHDANNVLIDTKNVIKEDSTITSFVGLLSQNISSSTPPSSPSRILKENENQWLTSEVADFSLSSFLGHLDSPLKQTQSPSSIVGEDTRLCLTQDVDAHLQSLLTESSLDYTAKFADLAAQVADTKK